MKKTAIITLVLVSLVSLKTSAEVQFLPNADENKYSKTDTATAAQKCQNAGYTYTNSTCNSQTHGQADRCPYSNSYFKICCPEGYTHTNKADCPNSSYSADNCHGYYKCNQLTNRERCLAEEYYPLPVSTGGTSYVRPCNGLNYDLCPYDNGYYKCRPNSGFPSFY